MILRRKLLTFGLAGVCAVAVVGCGFRPIYAPNAQNGMGAGAVGLGQVAIPIIPERTGQMLRQYLEQRFDRGGTGKAKLYDLVISYGVSQEGLAIERANSTATRTRAIGQASWSLVSADSVRKTITSGHARAFDDMDTLNNAGLYSTFQQEQMQQRLAEAIADQVASQIAGYFSQHPPGS